MDFLGESVVFELRHHLVTEFYGSVSAESYEKPGGARRREFEEAARKNT